MLKLTSKIELPLYSFFKALQAYDKLLQHRALGTDVYLELLEALGQGYGLLDRNELYFICKAFLFKPYHTEDQFKLLFDDYISTLQSENSDVEVNDNKKNVSGEKDDDNAIEPQVDEIDKTKDVDKKDRDSIPKTKKEEKVTGNKQETQKTISLTFKPVRSANSQYLDTDIEEIKNDIYAKRFRLRGSYSSVSPRRVEQGFRSLRVEDDRTVRKRLDLRGTIERVSQKGYLDKLIYEKVTKSKTNIVLLIDQGGSMIAFFHLVNTLIEKAKIVSAKQPKIYFFKNYPYQKLYTNSEHTDSIDFKTFADKNRDPVIILSDAGAARGRYDEKRIKGTDDFLKELKHSSKVWLNPMPKKRWANNSASYIAELVDMFEATDITFAQAIKTFK